MLYQKEVEPAGVTDEQEPGTSGSAGVGTTVTGAVPAVPERVRNRCLSPIVFSQVVITFRRKYIIARRTVRAQDTVSVIYIVSK